MKPQLSASTVRLQTILDRILDGDSSAYNALIVAAEDRLLKLTRRMLHRYPQLRRWEQTDDVFQNAMMRLHRSLSDVQPDSPRRFFGLAATQIRRTLIDLSRHHFGPEGAAAHHKTDLAKLGNKAKDEIRHHAASGDGAETLETWAHFHEAVQQLPPEDCEVFQLVWYGGLEQAAVGQLLDISVPTVQRRWYRARHQLAKSLSGHDSVDEGQKNEQ